MNREELRETLKGYLKDYVERETTLAKNKPFYVCPLCKSGQKGNKTGAFKLKGQDTANAVKWECYACGEYGDIFDLYGKLHETSDYNEQLKGLSDIFGLHLEQRRIEPMTSEPTKAEVNYNDFFLKANKDLNKTAYHRGISLETLNRFKVGFVQNWKHPKSKSSMHPSPRLIIPTSEESYLARDTRATLTDTQKQYSKMKVGAIHIFNIPALYEASKPIFVVEGEIDALSIIDAGGEAIALGSINQRNYFAQMVTNKKPVQPLIIALDNDEKGKKATLELKEMLDRAGVKAFVADICGKYKDANEALNQDKDQFIQSLKNAETLTEAEHEEAKKEYLQTSTAYFIQGFMNDIADSINTPCIETGFSKLDNALDGGLYEGLYIVGAISSLGKTTYVLQMADYIAGSGTDVLIFSLEMARAELMARSISRHTLLEVIENGGEFSHAKTARGILAGHRHKNYCQAERNLINTAIKAYSEYAHNIYIIEGVGDVSVTQIKEKVQKHISITGRKPVVIVDYLQILAPYNDRTSDKQNTDKAVLELKRMSRDYKLPVICVSSLNRDNYNKTISLEALKESGSIEYGSDVVIGLQFVGAGSKDFDVNKAKEKNPREVEAIILKNRNGRTGKKINYAYYSWFNYLEEQ